MHKFLRAIGFSDLKKDELENIFQKILENPTTRRAATDSEGNEFVEITKEFGDFFGISLRGVYRDENVFEVEILLSISLWKDNFNNRNGRGGKACGKGIVCRYL